MLNQSAVALLVLIATTFVGGCGPPGPEPGWPKEHFFVAFVRDGLNDIAVTWSEDGQAWQNGRFPATATSTNPPASIVTPYNGVGASADPHGVYHNIVFDQASGFMDVFGLGPGTWDVTGSRQSLGVNLLSAPSTVDLGSGQRLIAIRETGDRVGVYQYDQSTHTVAAIPLTGMNSKVWSRPGLTQRDDGETLIAWIQDAPPNAITVTAIGRKNASGRITFDNPRQLALSSNDTQNQAWSSPAVAADGRYFYLAVVQKHGGAYQDFKALIYRSPDGVVWSEFERVLTGDVLSQTQLGLAAKSNGMLLIASIADWPVGPARTTVALCSRTTTTSLCSWSRPQPASVFPAGAKYKEFAVIRTGHE
jgi:hypothetical protein